MVHDKGMKTYYPNYKKKLKKKERARRFFMNKIQSRKLFFTLTTKIVGVQIPIVKKK